MNSLSADELRSFVRAATKDATQEVAARNRRRLRVESLLIGVIVASAIAIPTTLQITHSNARVNCRLITDLAKLGEKSVAKERAATADFEAKSHDRLGLSQRDFDNLIERQQRETAERQKVIDRVAHHNCG